MATLNVTSDSPMRTRIIDAPLLDSMNARLRALESLVRAVEDELSDTETDDEQKLQNIGERIASVMDGE